MTNLKVVSTDSATHNQPTDLRQAELDLFDQLHHSGMPYLGLIKSPIERIILVHLSMYTFIELKKEEPDREVKRVVPQMGIGFKGELIELVVKVLPSGELEEPPFDELVKYAVDFFVEINDTQDPDCKIQIMVELDGHRYHSSPEQKKKDAEKDRFLTKHGYRVPRFTGSEVNKNPKMVVDEIMEIGKKLSQKQLFTAVPF